MSRLFFCSVGSVPLCKTSIFFLPRSQRLSQSRLILALQPPRYGKIHFIYPVSRFAWFCRTDQLFMVSSDELTVIP